MDCTISDDQNLVTINGHKFQFVERGFTGGCSDCAFFSGEFDCDLFPTRFSPCASNYRDDDRNGYFVEIDREPDLDELFNELHPFISVVVGGRRYKLQHLGELLPLLVEFKKNHENDLIPVKWSD